MGIQELANEAASPTQPDGWFRRLRRFIWTSVQWAWGWLDSKDWRWLTAGVGTALLLASGLAALWIARKLVGVQDAPVLTSLVVMPAVLYAILRGYLSELKGPGGWAATFVRVAAATVGAGGEKLDSYEDVSIIEKMSVDELKTRMQTLDRDQPVVMTLTAGRIYIPSDVRRYLDTLTQIPRFRLVALLEQDGSFVGCVSPTVLTGIMSDAGLGSNFVQAIALDDMAAVFRYPGVLRKVVPPDATNSAALEAMTAHNLTAIGIVENKRLRGVVERDQLVSKLVLSLTSSSYAVKQQ
jgi:CBS domain-containing protein